LRSDSAARYSGVVGEIKLEIPDRFRSIDVAIDLNAAAARHPALALATASTVAVRLLTFMPGNKCRCP
jgi:hypothetical protein